MIISTEVIIVRDCYGFVTILHHFRYFYGVPFAGKLGKDIGFAGLSRYNLL